MNNSYTRVSVDTQLATSFPLQHTGVLLMQKPDSTSFSPLALEELKHRAISAVEQIRTACEHWRQLLISLRAPRSCVSSICSISERFERRRELWKISPIVDFFNYLSLATATPIGAYDLELISGELRLGVLPAGMSFWPVGSPAKHEVTSEGEVGYRDELGVVCRYWNYKDSDRTKVTAESTHLLLILDLTSTSRVDAERQLASTACLIESLSSIKIAERSIAEEGRST